MKIQRVTLSSIFAAALLAACGGGGSVSTSPAPGTAPSQKSSLDAATEFLANLDTLRANTPTSGSVAFALADSCNLTDGKGKAYAVAEFDADPLAASARQFATGSVHSAPQIVAERYSTNTDGSSRREIDIKYTVVYRDGTKIDVAGDTIISGSSFGAKLADGSTCTTAETKTDWRFYGNRQVVQTFVNATNERLERVALATGVPLSPAVLYGKYVAFGMSDPANVATYAVATGPGLGLGAAGSPNGTPGSVKLLSARLLRSAPELAGKRGNTVDLLDTDGFRACSNATGTGSASAETANCTADGADSNILGLFGNPSGTALDAGFAALNIKAGDVYTFTVYADDGWKTVNGQAGKTPIASYSSTLAALPFSATTLAGTGPTADLFARVTSSTKTASEIATAIKGKTAISTGLVWTPPGIMPDARALALNRIGLFETGQANATGAAWPASSKFDSSYPGSLALSVTLNIPKPAAVLVVPTYAETLLQYTSRNGNAINSRYGYQ